MPFRYLAKNGYSSIACNDLDPGFQSGIERARQVKALHGTFLVGPPRLLTIDLTVNEGRYTKRLRKGYNV